ncbi:MAG TPA: hypothetical protein VN894_10145 [Polyangiaceae bacterium]|nr:hypothetical protein [Polyangiaceae bacterium]
MGTGGLLERLSAIGPAAQASVPGVYAWGVTVAPTVWAQGAPVLAKGAAIVALAMLAAGVAGEPRLAGRARTASLWGFVVACAVSWCAAPAGLSPLRMDAPRGLAGVVGWALFAFASAAPAVRRSDDVEPVADGSEFGPRSPASDGTYVVGAALSASMLQTIGWRIAGAERALLVRFVALAAGLAVIGAAAEIALQRHVPRAMPSSARRMRRALAALVALAILALAGLLNVALD